MSIYPYINYYKILWGTPGELPQTAKVGQPKELSVMFKNTNWIVIKFDM